MGSLKKEFKPRIVVVDDSEFSRKNIVLSLEKYKIDVVGEAASAEKAMETAVTADPNIFIVDIVMPHISGLELIKTLQEKFHGKFSVVAISSLDSENIIIDAISNGAVDFLVKPVEESDLIASIAKIIKIRSE